jgi:amidohydrolase
MSILDEVQAIYEQLITWRRYFHRHPELAYEEHETAAKVAGMLNDLGYHVQEGVGKTGVMAVLENGSGSGSPAAPVVLSRVDMDALPIQEENDVPYASENPGVMHACGHDAHIAIGLGVATLMAKRRDAWRGTLKLIFQPAEEGGNGAEAMIQDGVLEDPKPNAALAVHVWNDKPAGVVAATPGPVMAAAEMWKAVFTGSGGHAAHPEQATDPLVTAAMAVTALQTVVSRNVGALEAAVVTVGMFQSGEAFNVIPDQAMLKGTIRTYDPKVRETVLQRVEDVLKGTARAMGATVVLNFKPLTPAVVNDEAVTNVVQSAVRDVLGPEALDIGMRTMGSEDAAYFLQEVPGCYIFIGSRPTKDAHPHHHPAFNIDEHALRVGTATVMETLRRLMPVDTASARNPRQPSV